MSHRPTLQFWFDLASSYSYLSAMRLEALAASAGVTVGWQPFLLGPIFANHGWNDSPFNLFPAKGQYMWREMERFSKAYGLPFRKPSVFPRNSVLAARVACVAVTEAWGRDYVCAVYRANFAEDREIGDAETLREILSVLGQDADRVLAAALAPEHRQRLRSQTERAQSLGIFGAPSFIAAGELFFGNDRLEAALELARAHGDGPEASPAVLRQR